MRRLLLRICTLLAIISIASVANADSNVPALPFATSLNSASLYLANGGANDNKLGFDTSVFDIATNALTLKAGGVTDAMLASTFLKASNNLSDLVTPATARTNLGLGSGSAVTFSSLTLSSLIGGVVWTNTSGVLANASITGLVLGAGTATPTVYGGTSCTNQFPRSLNASGAATCASVATADFTGQLALAKGGTNADLSATGGTSMFLRQAIVGGAITVIQPTFADIASGASTATVTGLTLVTPALGTPASGNLANTTGFPTANLSGLGTGVATFLATPSSANLATAVTDETGSGALVFGTGPTISGATLSAGATLTGGLTATGQTITGGTFSGITLSGTTTLPGSGQITSGGNLGIGKAALPGIQSIATAGAISIPAGGYGLFGNLYFNSSWLYTANGSGAAINLATSSTNAIDFITSTDNASGAGAAATPTTKMRISTAGGVSIGTTTDPGAGNLLVNGNVLAAAGSISIGSNIVGSSTSAAYTIGADPNAVGGGYIQVYGSASSNTVVIGVGATHKARLYASGGFYVGDAPADPGTGNLLVSGNGGFGGSFTPLKPLHAFDTTNSTTAAQLLLQNQGAGSNTVAVGFQVSSSGEYTTYGPKAGIGFQRTGTNGRGSLLLYNRNANDTAGYNPATDVVLTIDSANNWIIGNGGLFAGLGGLSSAFPGIKRSGTTFQHRLGDDSADGPMSASTGAFSGSVSVTIAPTSFWGFDASGATVTIANGGNAVLPEGSGLVVITDNNAGDTALYSCGGGTCVLVSGSASAGTVWIAPTSSPGAGKASVSQSGGAYTIYNNIGGSRTFGVALLRSRTVH